MLESMSAQTEWFLVKPVSPMNPPITPAMSIRFGAFFGHSPDFWHGIQVECDFRALAKTQKQLTAKIRPATELSHAA